MIGWMRLLKRELKNGFSLNPKRISKAAKEKSEAAFLLSVICGVCSLTGKAPDCESERCGIEAHHTPQITFMRI